LLPLGTPLSPTVQPNLPLDLWLLATEGTQEFPPLKKHQFYNNFLSHSDNASCKLAVFDAAKLQIRQN
jgi:hypothetical protein